MAFWVLSLLLLVTIGLILDRWPAHSIFSIAALLLLITGVISSEQMMASFANPAIISIFILIIITSAMNDHFSLPKLLDPLLGRATSIRGFIARMSVTIGPLSAIMNNTPIVALMTPYAYRWSQNRNFAPSRVLMPLSFITIIGGMLTTIGTSTNLVLNGLVTAAGYESLSFKDFFIPGVIVAIPTFIFLIIAAQRLLKDRKDHLSEANSNLREYLVETEVELNSLLIGKTITQAGLRNLNGLFLVEILRDNQVISPVRPEEIILSNDRLFFAGDSEKVLELLDQNNGLKMPLSDGQELQKGLKILEAVVPANSDLIGRTLKQVQFRDVYDAAVIAIHRNGERLKGKIGEIELDKGDLLLISGGDEFLPKLQNNKNLYVVTTVRQIREVESWKKKGVAISFAAIIASSFFISGLSLFKILLLMLAVLFVFGLTNLKAVKKNVSLKLLLVLGSAIALSESLINTGAADVISESLAKFIHLIPPFGVVVMLYLITLIFSLFITNAAAVAIMFPVAASLIHVGNVPDIAVFIGIAFAASCSFITPFGYQTNLMVYGPGNYRFNDFVRLGLPLTIIYSTAVLTYLYFAYFG
ncbi:MAG: SLC13 family permease [Bacteroidetes bacterium]|nr:SLC13 family permease [Bacteroidota bacterium]